MTCVWAAPPTRMLSGLRAYQGVYAHIQGLPFERITRAASPEPRPGAPTRAQQKGQDLTKAYMSTHLRSCRCKREQFALPGAPKTQTTSPETVLFHRFSARWSAFWAPRPSDSLRGGGGNCAMQGCDTPATRRHSTSHGAKPPHHPQRRAPRHPTGRLGRQGTAAECDTNSQWSGPTVSLRRLGNTASPEATS